MDNEPSYDPDWTPDGEEDPFGGEYDEPTDDDLDEIDREEGEDFEEGMEELMSHYEQETQTFNDAEEEFVEKYGFVHKCRCAADWEEGNLGVVSVCYLGMVTDAMETLAAKVDELKSTKRELAILKIERADA